MKKILAMLLAIALTAALAAPAIATSVKAAEYNPYHCICGAKQYASAEATEPSQTNGKCNCDGVNHTWTAWDGTTGEIGTGEYYYYLAEDKSLSNFIQLGGSTALTGDIVYCLDLAGHKITHTERLFRLHDDAGGTTDYAITLNISDSVGGGMTTTAYSGAGGVVWDDYRETSIKSKTVNIYGGKLVSTATNSTGTGTVLCLYYLAGGITCNMYGGELVGGKTSGLGGTVYLDYATLNMYGGVITGGEASQGGAIYMKSSLAKLNINGGVISGGSASTNGGTIFQNNGQLTMTGGMIFGGTAGYGGGAICTLATTKISGGAILGGTANYSADNKRGGGAIFLAGGTTTISGDAVIGSATYEGTTYTSKATYGAVIHLNSGALNINGGVINGDAATNGGAVCVYGSTLTVNGGTIYAGNASDNGGAIALVKSGTKLVMNGGTIDARGKSANHGAAIGSNAGEVIINDGVIYGGTSTGSGGSAISGIYSAKVTINGGTIVGGTHKSTTRDRVGDGGAAVRIFDSTFTMAGGTISGGTIDSSMQNASGSVMITGNSTATISGNSVITGGIGADGKVSNLWLNGKTVTIGEGGLGKDANIGVSMATPGAFITTGATAQNLAYFSADAEGYYVALDGEGMKLTNEIGTNEAMIGDSLYATVGAAAAAANGKTVTLVADVETAEVAADVTLNLNGKTLKTLNIANGKTVTLADTSTDDYETAGVLVKVTGEGAVKSDAVVDGKRYIAIKETVEEDTYYSAHRIYLAVTGSVLSNGCTAMNFKTMLKCNDYVAKRITEYGVIVNGVAFAYEGTVAAGANQKTTQLEGFLKKDAEDATWAATDVQVNATIKLGETVINSAVKTRSLKTMVETVAQGWDDLDADQQTTLKTLYKDFGATAGMDSWNIPDGMKAN